MSNTNLPPFTFYPDLAPFSVTLPAYLSSNPTISRLLVSAVVVHSRGATPRTLLVQRAASDGFPLQWECPGGSVDSSDLTILHALQRELFEETGLALTRVVALLDDSVEFQWGAGMCRKVTFVASVGDLGPDGRGTPSVALNPEEHADFVWAGAEDVRLGLCQGREIKFAYETTKDMILAAFEVVREEKRV
jgi:8-oxo-dGTP pyrophosphatase MutT (NUDIX family)